MKRISSNLLVLLVVSGVLLSCTPSDQKPVPEDPKKKEKVDPEPPAPTPPTPIPDPGESKKVLELKVGPFESYTVVADGYEIAYEQF